MPFYGFGGLSVSRYLSTHLGISLLATKGRVGFNSDSGRYSTDISTATINLRFHLLGPLSPVRPYLFAGAGLILFDKNLNITEKKLDYAAPSFGGGINFKLSPDLMLNLQETFMYSNEDKRDKIEAKGNDAYLFHMVGLTFNFGKMKDADNDGVNDRMDKCPNTPAGVAVDKTGCPLDRDKDGVADYLDACPDVAGLEILKGCPDTDGDGIADSEDRCPGLAGPANLKGCPDTDKDGVADIDDRCPNTPAGYKVNATGCQMDNDNDGVLNEDDRCPNLAGPASLKGCPDTDNDGIADIDDRCPNLAGPASLKGCPDTDNDGVPDMDDRCPNTKGTIANKGCHEMTKEEIKKITQIASKIFFETNSAKLKTASLAQLNELTAILKKYESANLVIEGHTDSQGNDEFNFNLSQKRTESVKVYLMGKGIMESRLTATGFGETNPIADNKTATGRAKNRRVELKTSY